MKFPIACLIVCSFAGKLAAQETPEKPDAPAKASSLPAPAMQTDYSAARKNAEANGKDLLLVFTGSDWIQLCQLYERDILSQADFATPVSQNFEMVLIDIPKATIQSPELKKQNQILMRAYRISAFPTVVLTDSDGRPYAFSGYQPITPADYAKIITSLKEIRNERDAILKQASELQGVEKAAMIAKAIPKLPGNLAARYYRAELEEIIALDPNDETTKVGICKRLIADVDYSDSMEKLSENVEWSKMIELTDKHIVSLNLQGSEKQHALFNKIGIYENQGNVAAKIQTLLDIVKIDESTTHGQKAQKMLDGMRAERLQEELAPK